MMQDLKLERPLVVFDIESTGVVPQRDRIVELAVLKVFPDGRTQNTVRRLNPEMPIPAGATAIHGITNVITHNLKAFTDCTHPDLKCGTGAYKPSHLAAK